MNAQDKYPQGHCKGALDKELIIGSDSNRKKKFTFHVWDNEYRVYHNNKVINAGQAIEELLDIYNEL